MRSGLISCGSLKGEGYTLCGITDLRSELRWNNGPTEIGNYGVMETIKKILKGFWEFCSYVFVPQWGKNKE